MATLIRGDGRTVNAYQDSILGDFAFSGKDGIVKNVGQACGLDTTTLNSVKVKSGMVVIQGRQITLDGTDSISLPVATGSTVYWTTLYLELDLSAIADDGLTGKVTLKKLEYTSSYPAVPTSDNLKIQTAGKAYLGLYRFKNTANGVNSIEQIASIIDSKDMFNNIALKLVADFGETGKTNWSKSEFDFIEGKKYRVVWSFDSHKVLSEAFYQKSILSPSQNEFSVSNVSVSNYMLEAWYMKIVYLSLQNEYDIRGTKQSIVFTPEISCVTTSSVAKVHQIYEIPEVMQ